MANSNNPDAIAPAKSPILGVGVSLVDVASAADAVLAWCRTKARAYVSVSNVHHVVEAQDHPEFESILNGANMTVPDGAPLSWVLRRRGHRCVRQVTGRDLMIAVSARLAKSGNSAFYYGGDDGVADQLATAMEKRFPGLQTAGTWSPPFRPLTDDEEARVVEQINASGADVVWVGIGTPKQEFWMRDFRDRLDAPVLIAVGAVFDFFTGRLKAAPHWVQRAYLEWLFRLIMEPRRLWRRYATTVPRFIWLVTLESLRPEKISNNNK